MYMYVELYLCVVRKSGKGKNEMREKVSVKSESPGAPVYVREGGCCPKPLRNG